MQVINRHKIWYYAFFALAVVSFFLAPIRFDDGWVLATIDEYRKTGRFGYVFILDNAEYSLVRPYFFLLSLVPLQIKEANSIAFFIPALVAVILTFHVLFCIILRLLNTKSMPKPHALLVTSISAYFLLHGPTGLSLRPDIFVILGTTLAIWQYLRAVESQNPNLFYLACLYNALTIGFHPLAVINVLILFLLAVNLYLLGSLRLDYRFFGTTVAAFALSLISILWNQSIPELFDNLSKISSEDNHKLGQLGELVRVQALLFQYGVLGVVLTYGVTLLAILKLRFREIRVFSIAHICVFIVLFLMPSKWAQYSAFLLPTSLIILCVTFEKKWSLLEKYRIGNFDSKFLAFLFFSLWFASCTLLSSAVYFLNDWDNAKRLNSQDRVHLDQFILNNPDTIIKAPAYLFPVIPRSMFAAFDEEVATSTKGKVFKVVHKASRKCYVRTGETVPIFEFAHIEHAIVPIDAEVRAIKRENIREKNNDFWRAYVLSLREAVPDSIKRYVPDFLKQISFHDLESSIVQSLRALRHSSSVLLSNLPYIVNYELRDYIQNLVRPTEGKIICSESATSRHQ